MSSNEQDDAAGANNVSGEAVVVPDIEEGETQVHQEEAASHTGMDEASLEAIQRVVTKSMQGLETKISHLATKDDISDLKDDISDLKDDISKLATKEELEALGKRMLASGLQRSPFLPVFNEGADPGHEVEFVSIPQELVLCGVQSVLLPVGHEVGYDPPNNTRRQPRDIALVKLDRFPEHVDENGVTEWPACRFVDIPTDAPVSGKAQVGFVEGKHCAKVRGRGNEHHLVFIQDSGEPGNSGTLMFALGKENDTPLGVYVGVDMVGNQKLMKFRGEICPFPLPEDINVFFRAHPLLEQQDQPGRFKARFGAPGHNPKLFQKIEYDVEGTTYRYYKNSGNHQDTGVLVSSAGNPPGFVVPTNQETTE